jgi:hypothetical protein
VGSLLDKPARVALAVVGISFLGLFVAGWLASVDHLILDWKPFNLDAGLLFFAGLAQLVLATAVWFQINSAEEATKKRDRQATHEQTDRLRALENQALIDVVANASNAWALLVASLRSLRRVVSGSDPEAEAAAALKELARAEVPLQEGHAARYRLRAMLGDRSEAYLAAEALMGSIQSQRSAAQVVITWGLNPKRNPKHVPKPAELIQPIDVERDECLRIAEKMHRSRMKDFLSSTG